MADEQTKLSDVEYIKARSKYLRGTIMEGLSDPVTGAISADDAQLTKYHGAYIQDDRDLRSERKQQKLEPHYQFLLRLRLPAGVLSSDQWLKLDEFAHEYANGTLRLTTRQTFQYHGVLKKDLKPLIAGCCGIGIDSIGACGDVNRNVVANTNPYESRAHQAVHDYSRRISEHLLWKSSAYEQIWLDRPAAEQEEEPVYGSTYLPRKFKIAVAIPPLNDADVFANDIGLIAIVEAGELQGFNVAIGGGMGATYGDEATYPRLGTVVGYCPAEQAVEVCEKIITVQRDLGDRTERKHARFKYTVDDHGADGIRAEVDKRLSAALEPARPYHFDHNGDRYGWTEGEDGNHHLTLFVENGRVADFPDYKLMTGLRELVKLHDGDIRVTCNQNLVFANIPPARREAIEAVVAHYQLDDGSRGSALRRASMSCVAFPTCGLAMAEAERYLPTLIDKLDEIMREAGLEDDPIVIRMTGCPNGCARPYLGEIGFTGKAPGKYNLYLGASFSGERLNKLYRENIGEAEILAELAPMIHRYAEQREPGERFGDFVVRVGIIKPTLEGRDFHVDAEPA